MTASPKTTNSTQSLQDNAELHPTLKDSEMITPNLMPAR